MISSQPSPSIIYFAFDNSIEHEVLKVTSGHLVTITYHLCISPSGAVGESASPVIREVNGLENFKETLETMLRDETFMPEGGKLGFGLQH